MSAERKLRKKEKTKTEFDFDVAIVGGFGHVGLPLGIVFADQGLKTLLYDIDSAKAQTINSGQMPFIEYGADEILKRTIQKTLFTSLEKTDLRRARHIIVAIGTPVDEYLSPKTRQFLEIMNDLRKYFSKEQTIIIRSTVYPRTCKQLAQMLWGKRGEWHIAYCPERIAQGYAIKELKDLPQIIAGLSDRAVQDASELFSKIAPKVIVTSIEEAELIKLFCNAWRYIQFAVSNQFFMMCKGFGVDFNSIRKAMIDGYGRAATLPSAGFAAGPCLLKDTMQLASFNSSFQLGHAAMTINEGLPKFIVDDLANKYDLSKTRVGILGMAFKADIDDSRDSLSYKLGKLLRFHGATVFYSDEYIQNPTFVDKKRLVDFSEVVIIGAPHTAYQDLKFPEDVEVVDVWNFIRPEQKVAALKSNLNSTAANLELANMLDL